MESALNVGHGVKMIGRSDPSAPEDFEAVRASGLERLPLSDVCLVCKGTGRSKVFSTEFGTKIGTMRASDVKPITYMKTHAAELVEHVNEKRSPVVITQNGEPRAVVIDVETYEQTQDALALLKLISQSEDARRKKRWLSQEQMEAQLRKRFGV